MHAGKVTRAPSTNIDSRKTFSLELAIKSAAFNGCPRSGVGHEQFVGIYSQSLGGARRVRRYGDALCNRGVQTSRKDIVQHLPQTPAPRLRIRREGIRDAAKVARGAR